MAKTTKAASPAMSVLMITTDVDLDAQAGWVSIERCLIKPVPMRELGTAVSTLLPSTAPMR